MVIVFAHVPPKKKTSGSTPTAKKKFVWSDDEVELLLNVAADYKASKAAESVDLQYTTPSLCTRFQFLAFTRRKLSFPSCRFQKFPL